MNLAIAISAVDEASPAIDKAAGSLAQVETAAGKAGGAIGGFGAALGNMIQMALSFAVGGALIGFFSELPAKIGEVITSTTDLGQATFKLQSIIGGTDESASALLAVFERYGVGVDQASTSLGIFSRHLAGIEDLTAGVAVGGKSFNATMKDLGVTFLDASGQALPMVTVLANVADKFAALGPGADRTAIAMQLFGRSGKDLIPVLSLGAAGMQEAEDAATKYGLTLTGANVDAIRQYGFAHKDLDEAMQGVSLTVGNALLPALTSIATAVAFDAQTMNQTIIPAIKNIGPASTEQADIFALAMQKIKTAQAGIGSNATRLPGQDANESQVTTNMSNAAGVALQYADALGRLTTEEGQQALAVRLLGYALGYTHVAQTDYTNSTMGLHDANENMATSAQQAAAQIIAIQAANNAATPAVDVLKMAVGELGGQFPILAAQAQPAIAAEQALAEAAAAAAHQVASSIELNVTSLKESIGQSANTDWGAVQTEVDKVNAATVASQEAAANKAAAAAHKTGAALQSIGTNALLALPGLSQLDMAIAGTSQKLAAIQLQIEEKVFARMQGRPLNSDFQRAAYLTEELKVQNLEKAAGYTSATEGLKIDRASHLAGGTTLASQGGVTVNVQAVHITGAQADQAGTDFATFLKTLNSGGTGAGPAKTSLSGIRN